MKLEHMAGRKKVPMGGLMSTRVKTKVKMIISPSPWRCRMKPSR